MLDTARAEPVWAIRLEPGADPGLLLEMVENGRLRASKTHANVFELRGKARWPLPAPKTGDGEGVASPQPGVRWMAPQVPRQRFARLPVDPFYAAQWHLHNTGQSGGVPGEDIAAPLAWAAGYTGAGVVIGMVDDGLQYAHPDISGNYLPAASWDFNGDDPDPAPVSPLDRHGTAVAGIAAARDDGVSCGVGVAYRAGLGAIRLISDPVTDFQESEALGHAPHLIDIYSNSWGPADNGRTLEGPGPLTRDALEWGVRNGRGGLGSVYVWSAGNGAALGDDVNYDGYANSRQVMAVGAVTDTGQRAYYSEPGAPLLVVAPSGGELAGITSTDLLGPAGYNTSSSPVGDCVRDFTGTSASTPMVAGVAALMLEANPGLGWRDVKHLILAKAHRNDAGHADWIKNGAGRFVNHDYGYGRIHAGDAVGAAELRRRNLSPERVLDSGEVPLSMAIPDNSPVGVVHEFAVSAPMLVEHVVLELSATHPYRGDLRVELISPQGTLSLLANPRADPNPNYEAWLFSSLRHWGEFAVGNWVVRVSDMGAQDIGQLDALRLMLYGRSLVYEDVSLTHGMMRGVEALHYAGLTRGCAPGRFCPDAVLSRGQAAIFLERALHGPDFEPACSGNVFHDVDPGVYACGWVEGLFQDGMTQGCGQGNYCPHNPLTRAQAAIFLLRLKHGSGYQPPPCSGGLFADVAAHTFGCAWIEQLAREEVTMGCGGGQYCPTAAVTRGQMATFLTRLLGLVEP